MIAPRVDERVRALVWPVLAHCSKRVGSGDVVITCAGFEDRALAFVRRLSDGGARSFRIVAVDYYPEMRENRGADLRALALMADAEVTGVPYDRTVPGAIDSMLNGSESDSRIFVDVSGMSRLLIVQLVAAIVRRGLLAKASVVYTEAEGYPPSEAEVQARVSDGADYRQVLSFISSGVVGLTIVPELSTVAMQGQPIRLIAFPSFNAAQLATVCSEINAAAFTILNGCPPKPEYAWRRSAIRVLNDLDSFHDVEEVDVSTLDYRDTLRVILDTYAQSRSTQKLIVAPTGSKMQSVAVGLAVGFLEDIQVVYPTPKRFPDPANYTTGAAETRCLDLATFASIASAPE